MYSVYTQEHTFNFQLQLSGTEWLSLQRAVERKKAYSTLLLEAHVNDYY